MSPPRGTPTSPPGVKNGSKEGLCDRIPRVLIWNYQLLCFSLFPCGKWEALSLDHTAPILVSANVVLSSVTKI
ncbi:hypothetical protein PIB30_032959 [Stylosanthes scabra]|uniref:Uncharacterized protein n=1 Tax=Stylosanthes scabra TaxID=79078 RepID=A0ABU6ZC43_9FABA|nr:hypothetical protein [Stylosanthes scabra]